MPIATPDTYRALIDAAKAGGYALPAINVTSSSTMNAAMQGFAEAESDGIIQVSTGGGEFASGLGVKDMVAGAEALALFGHSIATKYPVNFALHTDHCPEATLDGYVRPLLERSKARKASGEMVLFQSHMFDGAELPLEENLTISRELLDDMAAIDVILEIEIGIVGGEEDGVDNEGIDREKLYTSPADMLAVAERLGTGENGTYLPGGSIRERPRCLQARKREARSDDSPLGPGRRRGRVRSRWPFLPGVSRWFRFIHRGHPRNPRVRRHKDEHRHRHPVRVHPTNCWPHVQQLRRCSQGGR